MTGDRTRAGTGTPHRSSADVSGDPRLGWGWLDGHRDPAPAPDISPGDRFESRRGTRDFTRAPLARLSASVPWRGWLAAAAVFALAAGLGITGALAATRAPEQVAAPTFPQAGSPHVSVSPTVPVNPACAGLLGSDATTVTDAPGDRDTLAGVIAAFEYGYYVQRSGEALAVLLAPEAGIDPARLAAGIASIPAGTRHCVAVTPVSSNAANVHLVEVHPDGVRVDYLQVIDVRIAAGATVIVAIAKAG
ncbi:hypothetical protein [Nocardia sp. alder85J]|uniref:hypothetical protein n=1 Tax=Nocardia sp. alder85J TaxID=2862949 RepID=UPI00224F4A09|nr:hypothetical protein [Nocardia sp. alder85J]MCX4098330.1 hypothetical protein [Nocardia sp. alder85J]